MIEARLVTSGSAAAGVRYDGGRGIAATGATIGHKDQKQGEQDGGERHRGGRRYQTTESSYTPSSEDQVPPLDSLLRGLHGAASPMAEIHTADLSSLDTDALKSRLTQLGRYL